MSWKDILKNNDEIKEWGARIKELVKQHNLDAEESQIFGGSTAPPVLFTIKNRKPNVYLGELKYPNDDMSDILDKLTLLTELIDSGVTVENTGYYYTTLRGKRKIKLGERRENLVDIYHKYFSPNSDKDLARQEEPKGGPAGFRQRDDIMFDYEMD